MELLTTRELKDRLEELQGKEICLQGWIRNHRKQKNISFIDFFDGTCFKNPQVVYDSALADYDKVSALLTINIEKSGTRREELLVHPDELDACSGRVGLTQMPQLFWSDHPHACTSFLDMTSWVQSSNSLSVQRTLWVFVTS